MPLPKAALEPGLEVYKPIKSPQSIPVAVSQQPGQERLLRDKGDITHGLSGVCMECPL